MAIRGGSAGGMTALNALAAGEGFAAVRSWYGVTDLMGLVATTHDFEAHYTDRLIGPLPGVRATLYEERSPVQPGRRHDGARCCSSRAPRTPSCRRRRPSGCARRWPRPGDPV